MLARRRRRRIPTRIVGSVARSSDGSSVSSIRAPSRSITPREGTYRHRTRVRSQSGIHSRGLVRPIVNCGNPKVSVVIPAMNESKNIARVIAYSRKVHPDTEVIVVVNGSNDGTEQIARRMGAKVIEYVSPLGHDVGRSIGAIHAKGEILLFTDADIVIPSNLLIPFIKAIENGGDVALNRYTGITNTKHVHSVVLAKHALNAVLRRSDLTGMSMTTIPHALSRHALEDIGIEWLAVPPKALAIAVWKGLKVQGTAFVDVGRPNPRKRKWFKVDPLKKLIIGDHLEAISWVIENTNERGGYTDSIRKRDMVK
jgi:glycosyltransferase involved in cell wall biosynthesis